MLKQEVSGYVSIINVKLLEEEGCIHYRIELLYIEYTTLLQLHNLIIQKYLRLPDEAQYMGH